MSAFGSREKIVFNGFRGVDPQPSGLYPTDALYVPQDLVENGLLRYALNCRFDAGRAYWYRNQLSVPLPVPYGFHVPGCTIATITRATNVVTVVTTLPHPFRYVAPGNSSLVTITGTAGMNSSLNELTGVPTTTSFTYAEAGADMAEAVGLATEGRPTALYEFVTDTYNQLLMCMEDGNWYYYTALDWTETPLQETHGYVLFSALSTYNVAGAVPKVALSGFAMLNDRLYMVGPPDGAGGSFDEWVPMLRWNGADMTNVGFAKPATACTGAADATGASNRLVPGRYSYRVTYGNYEFESMEGPVVDVDVAYVAASAYIEAKSLAVPIVHGDTAIIDGMRYRFVDVATLIAAVETVQVNDVVISSEGSASVEVNLGWTLQRLATMIARGLTVTETGVTIYSPPHPTVTAEPDMVVTTRARVNLTARETGTAGNALTLVESTADARLHVSAAVLSGGTGDCHIDLATIPTSGDANVAWRKLYRAYIDDTSEGVRGSDFNYLAKIEDNTTVVYADNIPQGETGEPVAFDRARPPSGTILEHHKDRLWLAGAYRTSQSYALTEDISTITRAADVVTVVLAAAHTINVGDQVTISGCTETVFNGTWTVTVVVSSTTFRFALAGGALADNTGAVEWNVYHLGLGNQLFYSALGEPGYWPAENFVKVGSTAPIVALVSWADQLFIIKSDSVWLLTGYGEDEWRLEQVPGATGAIAGHAAGSPFGICWAGHTGWMFYDGQQVRCILEYGQVTSYTEDVEGLPRPAEFVVGAAPPAPLCCWHNERFHMADSANERIYAWRPVTDTWEVLKRPLAALGIRAFSAGSQQSHILCCMKWTSVTYPMWRITFLDHLYHWSTEYQRLNGTGAYTNYAQIEIELPTISAPVGELVQPIELAVYGQWDVPVAGADDLKLLIYDELNGAWDTIGTVTQDARMGVPMGYAARHLRMKLEGENVEYFALHGFALIYTRRPARGA